MQCSRPVSASLVGRLPHQCTKSRIQDKHGVTKRTLLRVRASDPAVPASASVTTDDSVPEGHQNLHSYLYGEGGATEAHDLGAPASPNAPFTFHAGEDDGTTLLDVEQYLESRSGERPVGVFAIYDSRRNIQYVGYSRNIVLSVRTLQSRVGLERCAFVRVMVFANKAMQSRASLQREADNWVEEAGVLPPGNGIEKDLWEGTASFDLSSMSADELTAYEAKKEKMRKAMGEIEANSVGDSLDERQAAMRAAMEKGDWSAVVDEQTAETIEPVVTPFARASVHRTVGNEREELEMNESTVDKVLDDVRPYLIADGGNVSVISVENGIVALQLQGACGTCPSSTSTMKMGIERALKAAFGEQLEEVISVGGAEDTSATVEAVDMHLNMLRGAISAYGGSVEVLKVENGTAELKYAGPKPIGYGMVAAIKDKFRDLRTVTLFDAESGEPIQF